MAIHLPFRGQGACPGYLVRADGANILLDCGPGRCGAAGLCPVEELTGVIHPSSPDTQPICSSWVCPGLSQPKAAENRVPLYLPPDNTAAGCLCDAFGDLLGFTGRLAIGEYGEEASKSVPLPSFTPARRMEAHLVKIASTVESMLWDTTGMELVVSPAATFFSVRQPSIPKRSTLPTDCGAGRPWPPKPASIAASHHFRPEPISKGRRARPRFSGRRCCPSWARHLVAKNLERVLRICCAEL